MLATTSVKTNFCPKHGMRRELKNDSRPLHLDGLRYEKNLFIPSNSSSLKPLNGTRPLSTNSLLNEAPSNIPAVMVAAPRKSLMDDDTQLSVLNPRSADDHFLVSSQKELRDRVKSIEKTLDRFGSRTSLRSVGTENRATPVSGRNSSRTMPVYKPDKHIQRTQPPSYPSSQRVTPTRSIDTRKKRLTSKSPMALSKNDPDDEEIASLFRELEMLRTPASYIYDEPPSYRSKTPILNACNNRMTPVSMPMNGHGCDGHRTSIMDLNSTHHSVIGINNGQLVKGCNLPCIFRCRGCGDLQPIFTPNNNFPQFSPTSYGSGPPNNLSNQVSQMGNPMSPYSFNPQTMNPGAFNQIPGQNSTPQIIFMPYYGGMPAANNQTSPELAQILKTLSENLPNKERKRSIGTQSVEDLSHKNLDVTEDEIGIINKNDNLQSAANELFFDDDFPGDDTTNDNILHNARTTLELRELELSAWAAAKWWNFVKSRREEKRQAALDVDFEDFCTAEFPNREKLHSALEELEFATNELSPRNETKKEPEPEPEPQPGPSFGLPQGFTSFKQLSATAKASYKWAEFVEKKKRERREQGLL